MNRLLQSLSIVLCTTLPLSAVIPVQDMGSNSLGVEYSGTASGQLLLEDQSEASYILHLFQIQYSPVTLLRLSLGAGSSRLGFKDSLFEFKGDPGVSASAGAAFYIPKFQKMLSLTAGVESYYVSSQNVNYSSVGLLHSPFAGLIVHLNNYVDLELGGSYYLYDFQLKNSSTKVSSNRTFEQTRFYSSLTLHDPESGVYLSGGMNTAGALSQSWKDGEPYKSSVWLQFGIILKQDREFQETEREIRRFFPGYQQLKNRQEKMAEEISFED